jgi:hypothetical protein
LNIYSEVLQRLRENVLKTSTPTYGNRELAVASQERAVSHFLFFTNEFLAENDMAVVPHPPYFSVSPIEDKTERASF